MLINNLNEDGTKGEVYGWIETEKELTMVAEALGKEVHELRAVFDFPDRKYFVVHVVQQFADPTAAQVYATTVQVGSWVNYTYPIIPAIGTAVHEAIVEYNEARTGGAVDLRENSDAGATAPRTDGALEATRSE